MNISLIILVTLVALGYLFFNTGAAAKSDSNEGYKARLKDVAFGVVLLGAFFLLRRYLSAG